MMSDDFKFGVQILALALGGGITTYIASQAAFWKIDGRLKILEEARVRNERNTERLMERMEQIERDCRDRPNTPL